MAKRPLPKWRIYAGHAVGRRTYLGIVYAVNQSVAAQVAAKKWPGRVNYHRSSFGFHVQSADGEG